MKIEVKRSDRYELKVSLTKQSSGLDRYHGSKNFISLTFSKNDENGKKNDNQNMSEFNYY